MLRLQWRKALKIGKTDRYGLDISGWLGSDPLVSFNAAPPAGSGLVISDVVAANGVISCLISGATIVGELGIHFTYASPDRNDCQVVRLAIAENC
jgi:hypothetical protein